jgi:sugar lactone lactonase YvrE
MVGAIAKVKDENANCVLEAADACPEAAISIKNQGESNVFVVDNNGIHKFDYSGNPLAKWGSGGSGDGQVNWPHSVAVDSSGNVFVADTNNNRIQKFGPSGKLLDKWGSKGDGDGQFNHPGSIAVDSLGNVFVVDTDNNRIQVFNSSGKFLTKWGSRGKQEGQFNSPYGIAVDSSGNVFVADTNNNRIQKFSPCGELPAKQKGEGAEISKEELPLDKNDRIDIGHRGKEIIEKAYKLGHEYEKKHGGCCRCTVAALQDAIEFIPKNEDVFRTACCLDGGATPTGIQNCGAFTGSGIIIGYLCGTAPFGDTSLSHKLIREVYKKFKDAYGSVLCKDVKEKAKRDCPEVVARAARWTAEAILRQFTNYSKEPIEK